VKDGGAGQVSGVEDRRISEARAVARQYDTIPPLSAAVYHLVNALSRAIAAYEEGVRVNVGLIAENTELKRRLAALQG
jgi:hypothetical protein